MLAPGGHLAVATWCQREETPSTPFTEEDKVNLNFLYEEWAHPYFVSKEEYARLMQVLAIEYLNYVVYLICSVDKPARFLRAPGRWAASSPTIGRRRQSTAGGTPSGWGCGTRGQWYSGGQRSGTERCVRL